MSAPLQPRVRRLRPAPALSGVTGAHLAKTGFCPVLEIQTLNLFQRGGCRAILEKNNYAAEGSIILRKLARYLKLYKKQVIFGPIFKWLEAVFELIVPLCMAQIIDVGVAAGDRGYVLRMGGVIVLLGVVGLASSLTCQYFASVASAGRGDGPAPRPVPKDQQPFPCGAGPGRGPVADHAHGGRCKPAPASPWPC